MSADIRKAAYCFLADLACVAVFVIIGTRNHDTNTDTGGVTSVAAPFVFALIVAYLTYAMRRRPWTTTTGVYVWVITVVVGMLERSLLFDDGTALAFVIVAAAFLFATMIGWRGATNKIVERKSAGRA